MMAAYLLAFFLALCPELSFAAQLTLTWSDQSDNEAEFRVYRRLSSVPTYALLVTLPSNTETYVDTSVLPNESYTYQVTAANSAGESGPSNEASGTFTLAVVGDMFPIQVDSEEIMADPTLVLALGFNEGSGMTAVDSSGNGNDGIISGATWTTQGQSGQALSFDGVNDWVTVADANNLDLTNNLTLMAWVYPTALSGGCCSGWRTVLIKEIPSNLSYALYANQTGNAPSLWLHPGSDTSLVGNATLPLNTWSHLAATYDSGQVRLFVNGAQVASQNQSGNLTTSGSPLRIGGNNIWGEYFQGRIDDIRIYNRALTASEIQADMAAPIQ